MQTRTVKTSIKTQIWVIYGICAVLFLVHRYLVRSWIVEQSEAGFVLIVVNSLPNFIEGIVGTMLLAGIGLSVRILSRPNKVNLESKLFFNVVTLIAAAYVITQELNWYNISRANVYDPYDIVASILGLILINRLLVFGGILNRTQGPV